MIDSIDCAKCNVYSKCIENKDKTGKHICFGFEPIEKPQTNEEWFCQLSTEEKAKFLFEHGVIACNFCKGDCVEVDYQTKECKYNVSPSYSYTGIAEWLKQPHREEAAK